MVTEGELVGDVASAVRDGLKAVLSKVMDSVSEAVLRLPDSSLTPPAGTATVAVPSEVGARVKVKVRLPERWARPETAPPVTVTSSARAKVAALIGSPKSTVTVTEGELVGDVASAVRDGLKAVLSKVMDSVSEAVLRLPDSSLTPPAGTATVAVPSEVGARMKVKVRFAGEVGQAGDCPARDGHVIGKGKGGRVDWLAKVDGYDDRGGVGRGCGRRR